MHDFFSQVERQTLSTTLNICYLNCWFTWNSTILQQISSVCFSLVAKVILDWCVCYYYHTNFCTAKKQNKGITSQKCKIRCETINQTSTKSYIIIIERIYTIFIHLLSSFINKPTYYKTRTFLKVEHFRENRMHYAKKMPDNWHSKDT